jgi:hypothetical protein
MASGEAGEGSEPMKGSLPVRRSPGWTWKSGGQRLSRGGKEPMRRFIALLGLGSLILTAGCHCVQGKCDCGPQPGDAVMYAPYNHEPAPLAGTYESIPAPHKEEPKGR